MRNYIPTALLVSGFYLIHFLLGGTRSAFGLLALILVAGATLFPVLRSADGFSQPERFCLLSTFLLAGYVVARGFFSPVGFLARGDLLLVLLSLAVYLAVVFCLSSNADRAAVAIGLLLLGGVNVGVGLFQYISGRNIAWFGLFRRPLQGRVSGLFINPNHFAGFLEIMIVTGASLAWWGPWRPAIRIFLGYLTAMMVAGLLLSQSRAGYFSAAIGIVVFTILTGKALQAKRRRFATIVASAVAIAVAVAFCAPVLTSNSSLGMRVRQRIAGIAGHDARQDIWKAALRQAELSPVFGTGSGTFLYFGRQFRVPTAQTDPIHAHNDYLELWAEYGAVGVGLFGFFLVAHLRHGLRSFRRCLLSNHGKRARNGSRALALAIAALAAVAAYVVHSFFDFNMHIPANAMTMAFFLGLLANPIVTSRSETVSTSKVRLLLPFTAPAVAIAGLCLVCFRLPVEYCEEKARLALRDGNYKRALRTASSGVKRDPKHADLCYYLGEALRNLAEDEDDRKEEAKLTGGAVEAFRLGLKSFPQDSRLLLTLAATLDSADRFDEADAAFQQALFWDPNWSAIHAYYGLDMEHRQKIPEAKREYLKTLALGNALNGSLEVAISGLGRLGVPIVLPITEKSME